MVFLEKVSFQRFSIRVIILNLRQKDRKFKKKEDRKSRLKRADVFISGRYTKCKFKVNDFEKTEKKN